MELWFRTQENKLIQLNENKLFITKQVVVVEYKPKEFIETNGWCIFNMNEFLGVYKSSERVLEILNEIEQRLIDLQTLEIAPDSYKTIKRNINCVYEMPQE